MCFSHALELTMHTENACASHMARDVCHFLESVLQGPGLHTREMTAESCKDSNTRLRPNTEIILITRKFMGT